MKYIARIVATEWYDCEIEADNEEEAWELARDYPWWDDSSSDCDWYIDSVEEADEE